MVYVLIPTAEKKAKYKLAIKVFENLSVQKVKAYL